MAKQKYETKKLREWKLKEPHWTGLWFWISLNMFIQFIVFAGWDSYLQNWIVFIAIFVTFYMLYGTYPYYKVKYITTKLDAKKEKE